jgi:hypothetical protein
LSLKYPPSGIAIAAGFDQSFCLGVSDISFLPSLWLVIAFCR